MATIVETNVDIRVVITRGSQGEARLTAHVESSSAEGRRIRGMDLDITDQLSAARRTGATSLLDDIEARIRTLWEIPA